MKKSLLLLLSLFLGLTALAQSEAVKQYYNNAVGSKGAQLKTALSNIIRTHTTLSYSSLWTHFHQTDIRPDGTVWDMYSNATHYQMGGSYQGKSGSGEGSGYNREHSFPKSWFGNQSPMNTDLFHLYPTDSYVNNQRGNYPFGENRGERYTSQGGYSKLGACTTEGYSGIVFEPNDEYKGDFARTYFYMVTAYESQLPSWTSADGGRATLDGRTYPGLSEWQLKMLLRWAAADPVDEKERSRNEEVYKVQKNRNPYIDYPGLEVYVWGAKADSLPNLLAYVNPLTGEQDPSVTPTPPDTTVTPTPPDTTQTDTTGGGMHNGTVIPGKYVRVTKAADLVAGLKYILVCEARSTAMGEKATGNYFNPLSVTIAGDTIAFASTPSELTTFTLTPSNGAYLITLSSGGYLGYPGGKNHLGILTDESDASRWTITPSAGETTITNVSVANRSIRYNSDSPRFSTYTAGQNAVTLFIEATTSAITGLHTVLRPVDDTTPSYDLSGRRTTVRRGIIIQGGRKFIR